MNTADMKKVFYERYETSDNFLYYTFTGSLCTLLGHNELLGAPFLSCCLSMGIGMFSRFIGSKIVNLQSVNSDRHFSYIKGMSPSLFIGKGKDTAELLSALYKDYTGGAEILYCSDIPPFLTDDAEFRLSLTKSFLKAAGKAPSPTEAAQLAANGRHIAPYMALAHVKSGYCTVTKEDMPQNYPLPLTGYKIITAYIKDKTSDKSDRIHAAMERIRKKFPDITSISRLRQEHAFWAQKHLRDKRAADYIYHLANENLRLAAAAKGLYGCNIKSLFNAMNASQLSMERYRFLRSSHLFLARLARDTDGIVASRSTPNGLVMICETDRVNYAINMISSIFEYSMGYSPVLCVSDPV